MLFQVVCSVLLSVLAFHTPSADWLDLSTANQHFSNNRFLLVTQRAKQSTSSEGAAKTGLENDVRLFVLICFTHFYVWKVVQWYWLLCSWFSVWFSWVTSLLVWWVVVLKAPGNPLRSMSAFPRQSYTAGQWHLSEMVNSGFNNNLSSTGTNIKKFKF